MLFVDEFCGILVYIKFGADVTSQYVFVGGVMSDPWFFDAVEKEIQRIAQGIHYGIFNWDAVLKISDAGAGSAGLRGACGVAVYGLKGMESRQRV